MEQLAVSGMPSGNDSSKAVVLMNIQSATMPGTGLINILQCLFTDRLDMGADSSPERGLGAVRRKVYCYLQESLGHSRRPLSCCKELGKQNKECMRCSPGTKCSSELEAG